MQAPRSLLVTGGCGFIGSNYVRHLLASAEGPAALVNLDALTYAGNPANLADWEDSPRYRFVEADIRERDRVAALLREYRVEAVVHFAAESHVDRSIDSPEPFFRTNLDGTLQLLEAVRGYWRELPPESAERFRFLHVSTDEVYGSLGPADAPFTEEHPHRPNSPYAASKAAADHLVRSYHHTYGLPVVTTNCSNNYGPFQFPEKLIPLMLLNALEGRSLPIYGDGSNVRDWLFVEDHCRALQTVLLAGRTGEVYNIGGSCERTNLEIVDTLCALLDEIRPRAEGLPHHSLKSFVPDRPGHDRRYAIDTRRIRKELGWEPRENFESGLRRTVQWYLEHPDWSAEISAKRYNRERIGTAG